MLIVGNWGIRGKRRGNTRTMEGGGLTGMTINPDIGKAIEHCYGNC